MHTILKTIMRCSDEEKKIDSTIKNIITIGNIEKNVET